MNALKHSLLAVSVSLALVFTISCSSDDGNDNTSYGNSSSSGGNNGDGYRGSYGSVSHGGQSYKTVVIGSQTWMAENLNYNASGSKCYDDNSSNCTKYGRLYDWETAMTACPSGWHLPTNEEWATLENYVGGSSTAGKYLKATSGWNMNCKSSNGEDKYGFAALPGGGSYSDGNFSNVGYNGLWWSTSENDARGASKWLMYCVGEIMNSEYALKSQLFSVRCLKD